MGRTAALVSLSESVPFTPEEEDRRIGLEPRRALVLRSEPIRRMAEAYRVAKPVRFARLGYSRKHVCNGARPPALDRC